MSWANAPFGRVVTAMVTPFAADGSINLDLAGRLADHLVSNGSDGLVLCGTTGAMANSYVLTGDLIYGYLYNHGNSGSFQLTVETADPIGSSFTTVTEISGTFLGQTVTGLSPWYGSDQQIRNTARPFSVDGMAFEFAPLAGSLEPGYRDNVASFYVGASDGIVRAYIGASSLDYELSSEYRVSNLTISAVPEPSTYAMMGLGVLGLAAVARRRQKAR